MCLELGGNVELLEADTLALVVPGDLFHLDEIDHADELLLGADRNLQQHRLAVEALLNLLDDPEKVRARAVHLVDERDPRNSVLVGLTPNGLRLRLDAADGAEDGYGAVEYAEAALDLDREIDVTRRIDDVDAVLGQGLIHAPPETGRGGRRDRDAALLLLLHPVHDRSTVVNLADLVGDTRVEKDTFSRRRLAGIDVRHDANIAITLEGGLPCHVCASNPLITTGNGRRLYWLRPYGAYLRVS